MACPINSLHFFPRSLLFDMTALYTAVHLHHKITFHSILKLTKSKVMKLKTTVLALASLLFFATADAQTKAPEGYTKASITLANGTTQAGYIKDNIKKSASVTFIDENGSNKKVYEGSDINAVTVDAVNYTCINGDFFKAICTGKLCFLQKASNASGKASYNGTEAVFNNGTEGKIGDYFIYADKK